eukprot:4786290-Amphidinium_carterae.1
MHAEACETSEVEWWDCLVQEPAVGWGGGGGGGGGRGEGEIRKKEEEEENEERKEEWMGEVHEIAGDDADVAEPRPRLRLYRKTPGKDRQLGGAMAGSG